MLARLFSLFAGDPGIYQTVSKIKEAVAYSLTEPEQKIRRRAETLIRNLSVPERRDEYEIKLLADWVKGHFHYVHDPYGIEYVKSPDVLDKEITDYNYFIGDCDDVSGYLAALFKSIGYKTRLTIMTDIRNPKNNYHHIFTEVFSPQSNQWIALDGTAKKKPFGWSAPAKRRDSYDV